VFIDRGRGRRLEGKQKKSRKKAIWTFPSVANGKWVRGGTMVPGGETTYRPYCQRDSGVIHGKEGGDSPDLLLKGGPLLVKTRGFAHKLLPILNRRKKRGELGFLIWGRVHKAYGMNEGVRPGNISVQ